MFIHDFVNTEKNNQMNKSRNDYDAPYILWNNGARRPAYDSVGKQIVRHEEDSAGAPVLTTAHLTMGESVTNGEY